MSPTRRCILLALVPAFASLVLFYDRAYLAQVFLLDLVVVAIALFDLVIGTTRAKRFRVTITSRSTWSLQRPERVETEIAHTGRSPRSLRVRLDLPREIVAEPDVAEIDIAPKSRSTIEWKLRPDRRGRHEIGGLWIAVRSRLGLWSQMMLAGERSTVLVYPDLKQINEYSLLARTNRLNLIGVRRSRRTGGDTEFERLRNWQPGDPLQRVDWKATAKRDVITVRELQINQSQSLILMIDAGRLMVARAIGRDGRERALIDHAINAALMLAHVATLHGDRVGLIVYADRILRYIEPLGGARQVHRLIHALHDVEAGLVESRHDLAFMHLERRCRKRSLVLQITSIIDDVNALLLQRHTENLVGRHLPVTVLLRDHDLHDPLEAPITDAATYYRAGAAAAIVNWRRSIIDKLTAARVLCVDVFPEELTAAVVNRYLSIKAKHAL